MAGRQGLRVACDYGKALSSQLFPSAVGGKLISVSSTKFDIATVINLNIAKPSASLCAAYWSSEKWNIKHVNRYN